MAARIADEEMPARILDAALDLFTLMGFHGATVPEVAKRAKVGAGTIYRYFRDKDALVNALYRLHKEAIANHVLKDFPFHETPKEQFKQVWMRMADWALSHRREFAFLELHHHGAYLDDQSRAVEQHMMQMARSLISEAQKNEALRPIDPEVLIAMVQGAFVGLFRAGMEGTATASRQNFEVVCERLWSAIRGR